MNKSFNTRLSAQEYLLLHAALLPDPASHQAWQTWLATLDFEADPTPPGCFLLLPMVYKNLVSMQPKPEQLNRLKGIYQQTWYRSQLGMQQIIPVMQGMQHDGLQFCLLDGAAWMVDTLPEWATRSAFELSIYLPRPGFQAACDLLLTSGWKVTNLPYPTNNYGLLFSKGDLLALHLTWRPFPIASVAANNTLLDRSQPRMLHSMELLTAQPLDCWLFAACQSAFGDPVRRLIHLANVAYLLENFLFTYSNTQPRACQLVTSSALYAALLEIDIPLTHQFLQSAPWLKTSLRERLATWLLFDMRPLVRHIRKKTRAFRWR